LVVVVLLFLFSLYFPLSAENSCERVLTNSDQKLYKNILLSSKDTKTKLKYLEKFGKCINTPGVSVFDIKGIPVVEKLECGKVRKKSGMEFFLKNSELCGRSVEFFPSRKVFQISRSGESASLSKNWKQIIGDKELLIYDSSAQFKEGQDPNDRILKKDKDGSYTNSIGKMIHPSFVFENGTWASVTPLRELFDLKVSKDGQFTINIVTESVLPFDHKKIVATIGLKADSAKTITPAPSRYIITGKNLKAIRIPSLNGKVGKSGFNGRYTIKLSFPKLEKAPGKTFSKDNYNINVSSTELSMTIDLLVKSTTLSKDEIKKIRSIMDSVTPLFHAQEKNGK